MRVLVIDDEASARIKTVIEYVETYRHILDRIKRLQADVAISAKTNDNHVLKLKYGYRMVFSIEEQPLWMLEV